MRRIACLTICLALPLAAAQSASFDCAKASTATEKTICADPALSKADERLAEVFGAALAASLHPNALRVEQARWLGERDKREGAAALRQAYEDRTGDLIMIADLWRRMRRGMPLEEAQKTCLIPPEAPDDATCSVDEFGTVAGDDGLRYQLQSYTAEKKLRVAGGTIVFSLSSGQLTPIAAAVVDTAHYSPPKVVASSAGKLLVLSGYIEGTGNFSAEVVYLYDQDRPSEIDIKSWQYDLERRLPKDWGPWKGIYPDYQALTASTSLWQKGDGNCCPTAGRADVKLGLEAQRLVIRELKIVKGADAVR